jgi:hypothetical protein
VDQFVYSAVVGSVDNYGYIDIPIGKIESGGEGAEGLHFAFGYY